MVMRWLGSVMGLVLLFGCAALAQNRQHAQQNILLLIADDVGIDLIGAYHDASPETSETPEIDALAENGVRFLHAYSQPICSPTRATILTGEYGFRNGVGTVTEGSNRLARVGMPTLPRVLPPGYRSAAFGKWHLDGTRFGAIDLDEHGDVTHPLTYAGFEFFAGKGGNFNLNKTKWDDSDPHKRPPIPPNPRRRVLRAGLNENYNRWENRIISENLRVRDEWIECAQEPTEHCYITTHTVDDAIRKMRGFRHDPWFIWVGFNAIHNPTLDRPHARDRNSPPDELLDGRTYDTGSYDGARRIHLRALDHEIGRLIDSVDLSNTTIIFLSDNGTDIRRAEGSRCKGTFRECGIRVPLIIKHPGGAVGKVVETPVNTTDLFDTIAGIAANDPTWDGAADSENLLAYVDDSRFDAPLRRGSAGGASITYADRFDRLLAAEQRSIQNDRYKYTWIHDEAGSISDALYDIDNDEYLESNLLEAALSESAALALSELRAAMAALQDSDADSPDYPDPNFDYRSDYRFDNCVEVANATREHCGGDPNSAIPCNCDTDWDGIGNMCDCDFDNDGDCDQDDGETLLANLNLHVSEGADPDTDMNCDGIVEELDLSRWTASGHEPGPSGLWCADARGSMTPCAPPVP